MVPSTGQFSLALSQSLLSTETIMTPAVHLNTEPETTQLGSLLLRARVSP